MIDNCESCDKTGTMLYHSRDGLLLCESCMFKWSPPRMTLVYYEYNKKIWNVEVQRYEKVKEIQEFSMCGWFLRSTQEKTTLIPRCNLKIFHLEYAGTVHCGRVVNHPGLLEEIKEREVCNVQLCSGFEMPRNPTKEVKFTKIGRSLLELCS